MTAVPRITEPERDELEANRLRIVLDLAVRLRGYEVSFGFASSDLEAALDAGRVAETAEVSDWLFGFRTLSAVLGTRSAPGD